MKRTFECEICKKIVGNLMYHIKNEHNIEVQNYYNIYCKKSQHQGYCKICGKKTNFIPITKGYRIVCSKQCKKLKLTKDRKIVMNHKYGTDNIHLIPQIQEKITNTFIKNQCISLLY